MTADPIPWDIALAAAEAPADLYTDPHEAQEDA